MSSHLEELRSEMSSNGMDFKGQFNLENKFHRFSGGIGRIANDSEWYRIFREHPLVAMYGSWKTGEKFTWSVKGDPVPHAIYQQMKACLLENQTQANIQAYKRHIAVAELRKREWTGASEANPNHPYLLKKSVSPHGLRQNQHRLLVPLMDFHFTIWNLQTIYANGEKRFSLGGRISGLFSPIGIDRVASIPRLMICEGWATGATLHEVIHDPVICAMNATNITKVAVMARRLFPNTDITIAADNDRKTTGNPGITKANEAANLINAGLIVPQFFDHQEGSDFNDAAKLGWGK